MIVCVWLAGVCGVCLGVVMFSVFVVFVMVCRVWCAWGWVLVCAWWLCVSVGQRWVCVCGVCVG